MPILARANSTASRSRRITAAHCGSEEAGVLAAAKLGEGGQPAEYGLGPKERILKKACKCHCDIVNYITI
jgi:hypothetical protein